MTDVNMQIATDMEGTFFQQSSCCYYTFLQTIFITHLHRTSTLDLKKYENSYLYYHSWQVRNGTVVN